MNSPKNFLLQISLGLVVLPFLAGGQDLPKKELLVTGAVSASKNHATFSGAGTWTYGLGEKKRFRIGTGLRYNLAWNQNQIYRTAPAKLTSGKTDPTALFTEDILENIDTMYAGSTIHSINAMIILEYRFSPKIALGFNIDAAGFSFGKKTTGTFRKVQGMMPRGGSMEVGANPYPYNLLLISDNDLGSLNSELYATWKIHPRLDLRAGFTFIFSELQTDFDIALDNDRFRHKSLQGMVGIQYRLGK
jgi:hypothetical protein